MVALLLLSWVSSGSRVSAQTLYSHGTPTDFEQLLLELINRARQDPQAEADRLGIGLNDGLSPGTINANPKPPLAFHPSLIVAAQNHSQWMIDNSTFSHTGAGGSSAGDRMAAAGYVFSGAWTWGENIAAETGTNFESAVYGRHDGLFQSSGHRVNLLNAAFDEAGTGVRGGVSTIFGPPLDVVLVTEKFAASASTPAPLLVGVILDDLNENRFYNPGEGIAGVTIEVSGGAYYTVSSASGGYAVPLPAGSGPQEITFSGGPLLMPVTRIIQRDGTNQKLDLFLDDLREVAVAAGSLDYDPATGFSFEVTSHVSLNFAVQHSSNLVQWNTVQNLTLVTGTQAVTHQPTGAGPHFYRLNWTP